MPHPIKISFFFICFILASSIAALSSRADETREVAGKYKLTVGLLHEPAFTTELNGVRLQAVTLTDDKPLQGLEKTLGVRIMYEGAEWSLKPKLRPLSDKPGGYAAYFLPTRSGKYIFNIKGEVEGSPIDEKFESGPDTFNDVEPAEPLEYPDHRHDES